MQAGKERKNCLPQSAFIRRKRWAVHSNQLCASSWPSEGNKLRFHWRGLYITWKKKTKKTGPTRGEFVPSGRRLRQEDGGPGRGRRRPPPLVSAETVYKMVRSRRTIATRFKRIHLRSGILFSSLPPSLSLSLFSSLSLSLFFSLSH